MKVRVTGGPYMNLTGEASREGTFYRIDPDDLSESFFEVGGALLVHQGNVQETDVCQAPVFADTEAEVASWQHSPSAVDNWMAKAKNQLLFGASRQLQAGGPGGTQERRVRISTTVPASAMAGLLEALVSLGCERVTVTAVDA